LKWFWAHPKSSSKSGSNSSLLMSHLLANSTICEALPVGTIPDGISVFQCFSVYVFQEGQYILLTKNIIFRIV